MGVGGKCEVVCADAGLFSFLRGAASVLDGPVALADNYGKPENNKWLLASDAIRISTRVLYVMVMERSLICSVTAPSAPGQAISARATASTGMTSLPLAAQPWPNPGGVRHE